MRFPRNAVVLSALLVSTLPLSGCAAEEIAAPSASPDPTPTRTPLEEVEVESEPQTLFGGDCGQLLTLEAVNALTGAQTELAPRYYEAGDVAIRQLGGLFCAWVEESGAADQFISLVVLPSRAGAGLVEDYCDPDFGCSFFATAADFDLYGVTNDSAVGGGLARVAAVKDAFVAAVSAQAVPTAYAPASAWAFPIDCATLDPADAIAAALGDASIDGAATGGDAEPNPGFYAAGVAAGAVRCVWGPVSATLNASILPGGAWIADEMAARDGAQPVMIEGVDSAVVVDSVTHLFDGENWLALSGSTDEAPLAPELVELVSTTLIAELDARG